VASAEVSLSIASVMTFQSSLMSLGASSARSWALATNAASLAKSGVELAPVKVRMLSAWVLRSLQYALPALPLPPPLLPQPVTSPAVSSTQAATNEIFLMPHPSDVDPRYRRHDQPSASRPFRQVDSTGAGRVVGDVVGCLGDDVGAQLLVLQRQSGDL